MLIIINYFSYQQDFLNKGFILYELEKEEEAISCLNKIIELDADRLDEVYSIKGYCLFNLGKYKDATKQLNYHHLNQATTLIKAKHCMN